MSDGDVENDLTMTSHSPRSPTTNSATLSTLPAVTSTRDTCRRPQSQAPIETGGIT